MKRRDELRRTVRAPAARPHDVACEVDDELAFHIAMREEKLRAAGLSPEAAAAEARRLFGDVAVVRSECVAEDRAAERVRRFGERVTDAIHGARIAARSLRRKPGFAFAVIALLTIGIGGTTAVFSVVNAIYFRPLPYADAARLDIAQASLREPSCSNRCVRSLTIAEVDAWRRNARAVDAIGTLQLKQGRVDGPHGPLILEGGAVNQDLAAILGLRAAIGRAFVAADFADGAPQTLVLSHSAWQAEFGGDSAIVGQRATIGDVSYRIIGVLAAASELGSPIFSFNVRTAQYLVPRDPASNGSVGQTIARRRSGVTSREADAELASVLRSGGDDWVASIRPLRDVLAERYRGTFGLLLAAAIAVLLITCMNVGGLLVARLTDVLPELATRAVLGASRLRLVQQMLTEIALLLGCGTAGGLLLGFYGTRVARLIPADRLPFWTPVVIDARVAALAVALAIVGGTALSIAPIVALSPSRIIDGVRDLAAAAPSRMRTRGVIVATEIALSVALFAIAGVLIEQLVRAEGKELGSAKHSVAFVALDRVPDDASWTDRVLGGLRALPGVRAAAAAGAETRPPVSHDGASRSAPRGGSVYVEGRSEPIVGVAFSSARIVTPDYFDAVGTPIVRGRAFTTADVAGEPTAVINEASAKRLFPGQSAIGRRIRIESRSGAGDWLTIVGVSTDQKMPLSGDVSRAGDLYRPWSQVSAAPRSLVLRVDGDARRVAPLIRGAMRVLAPTAPVASVTTVEDWMDAMMWSARFTTDVLAAFAAFALTLACLGVYATVSYVVGRRRRELAVRIAVGATRADVIVHVMRTALRPIVAGLAAGLVAAALVSRVLQSRLYGSNGVDPLMLVGAGLAMLVVGLAAAFLPARRAAYADPLQSLRA